MAKMVGLSRKLRLPWLKYTVDLVATGMEESEIKDKINEFRIKEPSYNCQKYIYGFDDMCFCNAVFAEPEDMDTSDDVC